MSEAKADERAADVAIADARIFRYDLDAAGKPCAEGYYATDGRTLYLMPPTAELWSNPSTSDGKHIYLRLATQAEVDKLHPANGMCLPAHAEHIANCDPSPSDR